MPIALWQHGTNENANDLIREYLPKGADLKSYLDSVLPDIEELPNNWPRAVLGFQTPAEVIADPNLNEIAGVALQA
jgi:IS30 family transposase